MNLGVEKGGSECLGPEVPRCMLRGAATVRDLETVPRSG